MADKSPALNRAFDKVRDTAEAWRQQQIAAMTEEQRAAFVRWREEQQRQLAAQKKRIDAQKEQWIAEEKRRRLLQHQELALRMRAKRTPVGRRIDALARDAAERRAARAMDRAARAMQQRVDDRLRQPAQRTPEARQTFSRAAGGKDEALTRAFDKAARQREPGRQRTQHQRGGHSRGRGEV